MVTRTPKQTQAALREAARLSGLSRNVIAAQKRNMKTFLDEAEGKEKAAVTREDMTKVGLNPKLTSDLTKYLNMQNKKGRKPIEDDFRTTIKAKDKSDVPLVSPSVKKDKPKKSTRGGKVIYKGGRPGGRDDSKKVVKRKTSQFTEAVKKSQDKVKKPTSILGKVKERVTQKTDAKPLRDPKELLNLVGGATALTRAAPSIIAYLARNKGKKVAPKIIEYVKKLKDKRKDTSIRTQSGSGKTIQLGGANLRAPKADVNKQIKDKISRRVEAATKRRNKAIIKNKVEKKPVKVEKKPVKVEKKPVVKQPVKTTTTTTTTQTGPKLTQVQQLYKKFKNNPTGINSAIAKLDISPAAKSKLRQQVQSYRPSLKERTDLGLKKGGLIKRSVGGGLRDIPAGNKGLPNLPTAVRNKMDFKKKGGIIRRSKGGFLGAGKALRGQGAVMRKKGGKIAH